MLRLLSQLSLLLGANGIKVSIGSGGEVALLGEKGLEGNPLQKRLESNPCYILSKNMQEALAAKRKLRQKEWSGPREARELSQPEFTRTLWTYWAEGESRAPDFVKQCIANNRHYTPGWKVNVLNRTTAEALLTDSEKQCFHRIQKQWTRAHGADFVRLVVLKKYGGVWLDGGGTILTETLEGWLQEEGLIQPSKAPPQEALMFAQSSWQPAKTEQVAPIVENWFIAAKKGSLFVDEWLAKSLEYWAKAEAEHSHPIITRLSTAWRVPRSIKQEFKQNNWIYPGILAQSGTYFTQHWAAIAVIQKEKDRWMKWAWEHFGSSTFISPNFTAESPSYTKERAWNIDLHTWPYPLAGVDKSLKDYRHRLKFVNPGVSKSLFLKVKDAFEGPLKYYAQDPRMLKKGKYWMHKNRGHGLKNFKPRYFAKLPGPTRNGILHAFDRGHRIEEGSPLNILGITNPGVVRKSAR